jgi:C_GCAxxG_C_C family probable redox protein
MDPIKRSADYFARGYSCAQSVLLAFAAELGLPSETSALVAAGLGGGLGRQALTCGAVTGAILVIGLRYGSADPQDKAAKERTYELVRRFSAAFSAHHGSLACRDLLGHDISTASGQAIARAENLFKSRCPLYVQDAARILVEMEEK